MVTTPAFSFPLLNGVVTCSSSIFFRSHGFINRNSNNPRNTEIPKHIPSIAYQDQCAIPSTKMKSVQNSEAYLDKFLLLHFSVGFKGAHLVLNAAGMEWLSIPRGKTRTSVNI